MAQPTQLTLAERAKNFLASHNGDAEKAIAALLKDNHKYRQRLREGEGTPYQPDETLRRENEELTRENERISGLLPPAGAVVLTGDDAAAWPKFKALAVKPEDVTSTVKERDELRTKLADRERGEVLTRAAEQLGYAPKVFAKIVAAEGLHIEFKDVSEKDADGKTVVTSVPHVRPAKDDKASLEPLATVVARDLVDYLPALQPDADARAERENERESAAGGSGIEYPEQRRGGGRTAPSKDKLVEAARASGDYVPL